jgi:hypothetical protein
VRTTVPFEGFTQIEPSDGTDSPLGVRISVGREVSRNAISHVFQDRRRD